MIFLSISLFTVLKLKQTCTLQPYSQSFSTICQQLHQTCCVTGLKGTLQFMLFKRKSKSISFQLLLIDSPHSLCVFGSRQIILLSSGELICWHGNQNANGCERRMHSIEIPIAQPAACNHERIHSAVLTLLNFETDYGIIGSFV